MQTATQPVFEELDHREGDGIEVSLVWNRVGNSVTVLVFDTKLEQTFEISIANEFALDAFHHPYAYAAVHGLVISVGAERP